MENEEEIKFTEKKVDESWKSSVQKEKSVEETAEPTSEIPPKPELTFAGFVTSLAMQTLMHFGDLENPLTKKQEVNVNAAKETIDLLLLLKEKTQGNLTAEEEEIFTKLLPELQMRFVEVNK